MNSAKDAAAGYGGYGWCPIPIRAASKQPALAQLSPYLDRPATAEERASWSWPGVGIVTGRLSGVLVLDVDGPEGAAELQKHGHPATPMARTASGGMHLYFQHPEHAVKTGIRVAPGLDVKAAGGYVVAPPSVGANGNPYEWIVSPEDADLADPPEWLMRLIGPRERKGPAGPVGERIPPGRRNTDLASIAGSMRRRGMGEAEIAHALSFTNQQRCNPPLDEEEVKTIAASVARYEPSEAGEVVSISVNGNARPPEQFNLTDLGNSGRFVADHGESVRYCYPWRRWIVWTGARWERDEGGRVHRLAKKTVRGIYLEAAAAADDEARKALASHARRSEAEAKIRAMVELAKSERPVAPDELDADPWLLNTNNGTVNLKSGELREHRREDLITRVAGAQYDPEATCPRFERFLKETLVDETVISFMKRYAGYTLTGVTRERLFAILWGGGKNGKTTLVELLQDVMGDYAQNTDTETILAKKHQGVGNDVAALRGARFVSAAEVEQGRRLAESKVKQLTGSDTVTARFLFGEPFDFRPQFKLWLSTNNKPVIQGTDDAIWDRIRLIPFGQRFEGSKADLKLPEKLREELPGILAWMVEGCLEWQEHGLGDPESVKAATDQYRNEMDTLAAFIEDRCIVRRDAVAQATPLYKEYRMWCDDAGERPETQKTFGMRLTERGFESARSSSGVNKGRKIWHGIGLRNDIKPPESDDDRSPGEPCADDRSPDESGVGIGNTSSVEGSGE